MLQNRKQQNMNLTKYQVGGITTHRNTLLKMTLKHSTLHVPP